MRQPMILVTLLVLLTLAAGCTPTPAPVAPANPGASPASIVESFYNWYLGGQGSVLAERSYRQSEFLTPLFVQKVDGILDSFTQGGYDPFLCAQDIPGQVTADPAVIAGGEAKIVAHLAWNPGSEYEMVRDLTILLRQVDGQWRIDNVLCGGAPAAEPPERAVAAYYRWYLDYAGNPLVDRAYRQSEYLTAGLVEKVDGILDAFEGSGYDPFLCAQDVPESLSAETVAGMLAEASVLVRTSFEGHEFTVALVLVDGRWLLDDVLCGGQ